MINSSTPLRRCNQCQQDFPETAEFFPPRGKGFRPLCRACMRDWKHDYYLSNREKTLERVKLRYRQSADTICEYNRNYRHEHADKIREYRQRYYRDHADELREYAHQYRREHLNERLEYDRNYYREHAEKSRRYSQTYRRSHSEKYRVYNQQYQKDHADELREQRRLYRKANSEMACAAWHTRRARKRTAGGSFTPDDIRLQRQMQTDKKGRLRCWWCGRVIEHNHYHIDHRIPLVKGGSNNPENLCLTCPTCNLSKGGKLPHEWSDRLL